MKAPGPLDDGDEEEQEMEELCTVSVVMVDDTKTECISESQLPF